MKLQYIFELASGICETNQMYARNRSVPLPLHVLLQSSDFSSSLTLHKLLYEDFGTLKTLPATP